MEINKELFMEVLKEWEKETVKREMLREQWANLYWTLLEMNYWYKKEN